MPQPRFHSKRTLISSSGIRNSDGTFFIVDTGRPQLVITPVSNSITIATSAPTTANTRLGFTDITLQNATISLAGLNASIRLKDSNQDNLAVQPDIIKRLFANNLPVPSPGLITASELIGNGDSKSNRYVDLAVISAAGGIALDLGISGGVGSQTQTGNLRVNWPDMLAPATLTTVGTQATDCK